MKPSGRFVTLFLLFILSFQANAFTTIREKVKTVDSIDIEIVAYIPEAKGKFPVFFFVHGGGWSHGTAHKTPGASNILCADMLCDNLGVVFIGIDYRCKNQNGDFDKALQDVMDGYNYTKKNAKRFKCDFKRVGFGGGSAGTPLSAVASQKIANCILYVGIHGRYDFINNLGGYWPDAGTAKKFRIVTPEEQKRASAISQIRKNPPATLLIHGDKDATIGHLQSLKYEEAIQQNKGFAKTVILPNAGHGFYRTENKDFFVKTTEEIMEHLITFFKIKNPNREAVKKELEKATEENKNS